MSQITKGNDIDSLDHLVRWFHQPDDSALQDTTIKQTTALITKHTGIALPAKDWEQLRTQLVVLQPAVQELEPWDMLRDQRSFKQVKAYLSKRLGHPVRARSWAELGQRVVALCAFFTHEELTAEERFEAHKLHNFRASSALEGITLPDVISQDSVQDLIEQIRKKRG